MNDYEAEEPKPTEEPSEPDAVPAPSGHAWSITCHLTSLAALLVFLIMPVPPVPYMASLLASFLVWQALRDERPDTVFHAKEAFNFQANLLIVSAAAWASSIVCCCTAPISVLANYALLPVTCLVLTLVAAVKASEGERWRYPYLFWRPLETEPDESGDGA